MAEKIFAAIDVGSFELGLKIYEISPRYGIRALEHVRYRLALGTDSYVNRKISYEKMEELFRVLREFQTIMQSYKVSEYRAYGTSAIRETENTAIILEQIKNRTGIRLEVLSNSEQRFLDYKAIASSNLAEGRMFSKIIEKETAIVDIGGGNTQISLFDKDRLILTQNIKLGVLRLYESMEKMQPRAAQLEELLDEIILEQIHVFRKMYLKDSEIKRLILMDEYLSPLFVRGVIPGMSETRLVSADDFVAFDESLKGRGAEELSDALEVSEETVTLVRLASALVRRITEMFSVESIWAPGVSICDGMAYEYAEQLKLRGISHDFEQDILASASNISKRYLGSRKRRETLEKITLTIFDAMTTVHGMGSRERLLLQLAAILHDCGKYINMYNVGECSFNIVMNTEIIGLSHREREMVAFIVKFNHDEFEYFEDLPIDYGIDMSAYLTIAKLTAILRIANALDKSHKEKFRSIRAELDDDRLQLYVNAGTDILFEKDRFERQIGFFEEVYGIRPAIVQK